MIAGSNGTVRIAADALFLCLRPPAAAKQAQFDRLAERGVLVSGPLETILIGRLPDRAEAGIMRELLGLQKDNAIAKGMSR